MSSEKRRKGEKSSLGERLLSIRGKSGLTLEEFAVSLGMKSGAYFSDLENGVKSTISSKLIKKICELYHISPNWLLTGDGDMDYSSVIQKNGGSNEKNSSGEGIHMLNTFVCMWNRIDDLFKENRALRSEIIELKRSFYGKQKKNQEGESN